MLKHIVWWTFKSEAEGRTAKENALLIQKMGLALAGRIESLRHIEISVDILPTSNVPAQLVLQTVHEDAAGLTAYATHPEHLKLAELLGKVTDSRHALDYTLPD